MHLIFSTNLNPKSRTRVLAESAFRYYKLNNAEAEIIDLAELKLPMCDGNECYNDPTVKELTTTISSAVSLLIVSPIYNYDLNAAAKNLLELTGIGWQEKTVGFICSAGGIRSYMAVLPFVNSIVLDYRCKVIPRFVYATRDAFTAGELVDKGILRRIQDLVAATIE